MVVEFCDRGSSRSWKRCCENGPGVFAHHSEIDGHGYRGLEDDQRVEFEVTQGPKGPQATAVRAV
ncbi:cold-shock protein [Lentzea kentuckyensis]|uniref:cold-shock protein n=1 Tax=Lentzea kentuckyensis TaxID=360086 RepID=UPI000A39158D|nr:cold shock domain-containing protein [Lentzea kentuckyensis]